MQTQQSLLENLAELFVMGEYRLLIVDSVIALFRSDFSGRGELADRQQGLMKFLHMCNKLACGMASQLPDPVLTVSQEFNIVVFLVSGDVSGTELCSWTDKPSDGGSGSQVCALQSLIDADSGSAMCMSALPTRWQLTLHSQLWSKGKRWAHLEPQRPDHCRVEEGKRGGTHREADRFTRYETRVCDGRADARRTRRGGLCLRDQQWRDHRCGQVVIKDKHG